MPNLLSLTCLVSVAAVWLVPDVIEAVQTSMPSCFRGKTVSSAALELFAFDTHLSNVVVVRQVCLSSVYSNEVSREQDSKSHDFIYIERYLV